MTEAALHGLDNLLRDEADADAVRMERREDLAAERGFDLVELGLSELALERGREEDEVRPFRIRDGLYVAKIYG